MIREGADDGGLQPERTILAWQRTTLTAVCVMLLSIRAWAHRPTPTTLVTMVLCAALVVVVAAYSWGLMHDTPASMMRSRCRSTMFSISALVCGTSVWLLYA